jgi:hypothetical protein
VPFDIQHETNKIKKRERERKKEKDKEITQK